MAFPIKTIMIAAAVAASAAAYAADVPTLDVSADVHRRLPATKPSRSIPTGASKPNGRRGNSSLANGQASRPRTGRCARRAATMGGMSSYVALITCLEMKRDVAKLPADRGLTVRPAALPQK